MLLTNTTLLKDKDELKKRIIACRNCENYTKVKTCKICRCFMPFKRKFLYAKCPENKWTILKDGE